MNGRSFLIRLWWAVKDYARRLWDVAGEDNISFLAGGIAFNLLLAAVPFTLLLLAGLGYVLNESPEQSSNTVWGFIDNLMPPHAETGDVQLRKLLDSIIKTRGSVGLLGAIAFIWFSTRLFGTLRSVLSEVFDIEQGLDFIKGKLFDIKITVVSTVLFVVYAVLSAYMKIATSKALAALKTVGFRGSFRIRLEYWIGNTLAVMVITGMFFALYKFLPSRKIRWQPALVGALFTSVLFELAKQLFTSYLGSFNPGSLYAGTLYGIVIVVFWVYYAALIFILGGEVGQVYELRRTRRLQRETFES
ncbi:MAG: YihY/virulence factor BrkB family protein [Gemmatimonadaceae bacterium]|nr:YihY/virulence factor BrkB family protein [Gemmatimonadaceae bacterium]